MSNGDINLSSDARMPKRFMGVRYEPQISTGTLLVLLGFAVQAVLFWSGVEHRLTKNEDNIASVKERTEAWHSDGVASRTQIAQAVQELQTGYSLLNGRLDILVGRK